MPIVPDLYYALEILKFRLNAYLDTNYLKEVDKVIEG